MSAANPRRAKDVNDCGFSGTGLSLSLCSLSILCYLSLSFSKYSEIIKKRVINSTAVLEATGPLSIYLYIFFFLFFLYLHFFSLALFLYIHLYLSIGIYISLSLFYLACYLSLSISISLSYSLSLQFPPLFFSPSPPITSEKSV